MAKGVYCLVLAVDSDKKISVAGRNYNLPEGFYCYVGSDQNVHGRIRRHVEIFSARDKGKPEAHIDHVLKHAKLIYFNTIETQSSVECIVNEKIRELGDGALKGFNPPDCRTCKGHLHYFRINPLFRAEFHDIFEGKKYLLLRNEERGDSLRPDKMHKID